MRFQHEADRGSLFVPDAVAVCGDDAEGVFSRIQMGIVGIAARARVNPPFVESHELVFVPDLFRAGEADPGIVKFKPGFPGRHLNGFRRGSAVRLPRGIGQ